MFGLEAAGGSSAASCNSNWIIVGVSHGKRPTIDGPRPRSSIFRDGTRGLRTAWQPARPTRLTGTANRMAGPRFAPTGLERRPSHATRRHAHIVDRLRRAQPVLHAAPDA